MGVRMCDLINVTINPYSKVSEFKFVSTSEGKRDIKEIHFNQEQIKSLHKLTEDILNAMRGKSVKQFNRSLG